MKLLRRLDPVLIIVLATAAALLEIGYSQAKWEEACIDGGSRLEHQIGKRLPVCVHKDGSVSY
jgi:hypothetical protein